jgi:hypothetical protein
MQLSEIREGIAPLFLTTNQAMHQRQKELYREPLLRAEGLVGHRGRDSGPPATYKTTAILVIAGLLGQNRFTIGRRTTRLWTARYERIGAPCPITGATTLGGALAAILSQPKLCGKLDYIELAHEYEAVSLVWRKGLPSLFHPHSAAEWQRRRQEAIDHGGEFTHITKLPGGSMRKIAILLDEADRSEA